MTRTTRRLLTFAFAATSVVLFGACSGESEGQRCETTDDPGGPDNYPGGSDCASNLDCYPASQLGGVATSYASAAQDPTLGICCPPNRALATTSICALQPSPPGGDAGFVDGGGTSDAPSGDSSSLEGSATSEGSTSEASSDALSDSPPDSTSDGPG
jgi:hypothetical protein